MSDFRRRILEPLALPVASIVFIGGLVWGLSRFLLVTDADLAVVIAFVVSLMILVVAAFMANAPRFGAAQKFALVLLGIAIAAGGTVTAATIGIRPFHNLVEPDIELTAKGLTFLERALALPTLKDQYNVELDNQDAGIPHNFALFRDRARTQVIFRGTLFAGVATQPNFFKNPGPGLYFFQCDAHPVPNMQGTLVIGPPPPGAPGGPGGPGATPAGGASSPAAHVILAVPLLLRRRTATH